MRIKKIKDSVNYQLSVYPESTLLDIYKNFFQDRFGPGHLIEDTAAARNYLSTELASTDTFKGPLLDPTGYKHRFYRVNLALLKNGTIPFNDFFNLFMESSGNFTPPSLKIWKKEWKCIEKIISRTELDIPGYTSDKSYLEELISSGEYVVHHSERFIKKYDPHYRIVKKKLFDSIFGKIIAEKSLNQTSNQ